MSYSQANLHVEKLSPRDFYEIRCLRRRAFEYLDHPDNYVLENDDAGFIKDHLADYGVSFGFRYGSELIGYCSLATDIKGTKAIDELFPLVDKRPQARWGALAATVVSVDGRGMGLQRQAIKVRCRAARELGISYLGVTVSPNNVASLKNLLREGGVIDSIQLFKDGRRRMLIEIPTKGQLELPSERQDVIANIADIDLASKLLGGGFRGREIWSAKSTDFIVYTKELNDERQG